MSDTPVSFKIGDKVQWTSQAGGHKTLKRGVVIGVVPSLTDAFDALPAKYWSIRSLLIGIVPRNERSYLVLVTTPSPRVYWPRVRHLRKE